MLYRFLILFTFSETEVDFQYHSVSGVFIIGYTLCSGNTVLDGVVVVFPIGEEIVAGDLKCPVFVFIPPPPIVENNSLSYIVGRDNLL